MKTTVALLVKFVATLAAAGIAFSIMDNNPWSYAFLIAILGTVVNYIVGDLMVLPNFGNTIAALGDGVMAALVALFVDLFSTVFNTGFVNYLVFGVIVLVAEYFFHNYLKKSEEVAP